MGLILDGNQTYAKYVLVRHVPKLKNERAEHVSV